jgi:membrane protease YdiL (CAAX protease family)
VDAAPDRLGRRFALFAALAYGISWTLWFLAPLLAAEPGATATMDALATFGPALAALVLMRDGRRAACAPATGRARRMLPPLLALGVGILVLGPRWAATTTVLGATLLIGLTLLPAALIWLSTSRDRGLRELLGTLSAPRSPWWTYVAALAAFPVLSALGSVVVTAFGGSIGASAQIVSDGAASIALVFFATLLYGGPLGEEVGWRGWAVPALQRRFSPLLTSLFVGLLWGLWHIPLHLRGVYDTSLGGGLAGILLRIASSCLLAVVFTWLYNRSRGGLVVMVLLHTSVNNTSGYWLPVNIGLTIALLIVAATLVITDKMYERRATPERAVVAPGG